MKKTLIGLLAVALSFTAFSCDSPLTSVKEGTDVNNNAERKNVVKDNYTRIDPTESKLSKFRVEEELKLGYGYFDEDHNNDVWHLTTYFHCNAKTLWDKIVDYSSRNLGDKVSIEYAFDKHPWYDYDHEYWFLVVNHTKIAGYEKVGGSLSIANDHIRLSKLWWSYWYKDFE